MPTLVERSRENTEVFDRAAGSMTLWRQHPHLLVQNEFGARPDPWQRRVLDDFARSNRIALVACKGPGKTAVLAWCIWNFALTRPSPKIVLTSITGENLRDNLWAELSKWGRRSKIVKDRFDFGKERIVCKENPDNWFIAARRWARDADPDAQENTLAGFHAEFLLFVLDEAGGIPGAVAATAEAGLSTGTETKLLIAGNPTHLSGPLYDAAQNKHAQWSVHYVNSDPDNPDRAPQVKRQWALDMREKWGEDSAWYQVNVLGQFPKAATEGLLALGRIEDAFGRTRNRDDKPLARLPRVLGVDVARFGNDWNRVCFREGDFLVRFEGWQGEDTTVTAARIAQMHTDFEATEVRVDDIGVGGGVVDQLAAAGIPVIGVNVGEKADDPEHYFNLRSELACQLRDRFRDGRISLSESVRSTTLAEEGSTIRVQFANKGQLQLEAKDSFRKRARRSPDFLDAAMLAFATHGGPSYGAYAPDEPDHRGLFNPWKRNVGWFTDRQSTSEEQEALAARAAILADHSGTLVGFRGRLWDR